MIWQSFVVPILATGVLFGLFYLIRLLLLDALFLYNFWLAVAVGLIFIFLFVLIGYFPLTVFLVGWDENSIIDLQKAVKMSGASKAIIVPLKTVIVKASKHAKMHNRFKYDETEAFQEARRIMELRDLKREEQLRW